MSADFGALGFSAIDLWKQYLKTYENPKVYTNVTRERAHIRFSAQCMIDECDESKGENAS